MSPTYFFSLITVIELVNEVTFDLEIILASSWEDIGDYIYPLKWFSSCIDCEPLIDINIKFMKPFDNSFSYLYMTSSSLAGILELGS